MCVCVCVCVCVIPYINPFASVIKTLLSHYTFRFTVFSRVLRSPSNAGVIITLHSLLPPRVSPSPSYLVYLFVLPIHEWHCLPAAKIMIHTKEGPYQNR